MAQRNPPVAGDATVSSLSSAPSRSIATAGPHDLECLIQRGLQTRPGLKFTRLTVHKCTEGVCLEGLLETNEDGIDLCDLVQEIAGVQAINHVVMHPSKPK